MLIGLATAVKLTPGVFLIYLRSPVSVPARREEHRRTFFMAAFTAALLTLLPFLVIPDDASGFWFRALLDSERLGANAATTNQSLRGMLIRLYLPDWLTTLLWLALVAVIAWYGFRHARRALLDGTGRPGWRWSGLMAVLLSPVAWIHHLAWVVVVLGALFGSGPDPVRVRVAAGVWLYYVLPIPWWGVTIKAPRSRCSAPCWARSCRTGSGWARWSWSGCWGSGCRDGERLSGRSPTREEEISRAVPDGGVRGFPRGLRWTAVGQMRWMRMMSCTNMEFCTHFRIGAG